MLTDDEAGMLYWLREFPDRSVEVDDTIISLIAKGLLNRDGASITLTAAGMLWTEVRVGPSGQG